MVDSVGSPGGGGGLSTFAAAYQDEATDQALTDGATAALALDTAEFDTDGGAVDLANDQLVTPSAGVYQVGFTISTFNGTGTAGLTCFLGSDGYPDTLLQSDERANSDGTVTDAGVALADLPAGATVYLNWRPVGSGMTIDGGPGDAKLWFMKVGEL